jgi:adenine C2-methylase RlmN of 23S rRNA A2503 and tRNA A37
MIRTSKGSDILAACGQLSGRKTATEGEITP